MDNVKVGNSVLLRGVIVDEGVTIEDDVVVDGRGSSAVSVISALSVLGKGTRFHL